MQKDSPCSVKRKNSSILTYGVVCMIAVSSQLFPLLSDLACNYYVGKNSTQGYD